MGPTLHVIIKANDDIDNNEDALGKRTLIKCVKSIKKEWSSFFIHSLEPVFSDA